MSKSRKFNNMKSTAIIRTIASAIALISIPAFVDPVGAAGLIFFDDSCAGTTQAWLEATITRSITVASRMQDRIFTDEQTKTAVGRFLEGEQGAVSVVFNAIGALTIAEGATARQTPGTGDVVFI